MPSEAIGELSLATAEQLRRLDDRVATMCDVHLAEQENTRGRLDEQRRRADILSHNQEEMHADLLDLRARLRELAQAQARLRAELRAELLQELARSALPALA